MGNSTTNLSNIAYLSRSHTPLAGGIHADFTSGVS
jgi:hypothetical protein